MLRKYYTKSLLLLLGLGLLTLTCSGDKTSYPFTERGIHRFIKDLNEAYAQKNAGFITGAMADGIQVNLKMGEQQMKFTKGQFNQQMSMIFMAIDSYHYTIEEQKIEIQGEQANVHIAKSEVIEYRTGQKVNGSHSEKFVLANRDGNVQIVAYDAEFIMKF
ncbi:hypothetical protein JW877_05865 [bacterium]|nr:hypothetical protein [bacterium]